MDHRSILLTLLIICTAVKGYRRIPEGCNNDCAPFYDPVCGSDGSTYHNECELTAIAECSDTPELTKVKDRPCDVGKRVMIETVKWEFQALKVKIGSKSKLTINFKAGITDDSDSLSGKKLWKLGIFGSEWEDGFGERVGYVEQLLTKNQASKSVRRGTFLKLKNLRARFDLSQIGCGAIAFFCVELAKDMNSSVNFELRAGIQLDSIITCKRLPCLLPNAADNEQSDLPPTCFLPCPDPEGLGGTVCGNNSVEYESFCELTKAARCEQIPVKFSRMGQCPPEVVVSEAYWSFEARHNPDDPSRPIVESEWTVFNEGSDIVGTDLWQMSMFGSTNENGLGVRSPNQPQILNRDLSSQPLTGGFPFNLNFETPFNIFELGCDAFTFLCLEFKRNPNASTEFVMRKTSGEQAIRICSSFPCVEPTVHLHFDHVRWEAVYGLDTPNILTLNVSVDVGEESEEIKGGSNLWRIGIYASRYPDGRENAKRGYIPQLLFGLAAEESPDIIANQTFVFPLMRADLDFDLSSVACTDYRYLCCLLAKQDQSSPDFVITSSENRRRITSCLLLNCSGTELLPLEPPAALLSYLTWNLTVASVREDNTYEIEVAVNVVPREDTDTIVGTGLWRIGLFLSNATTGNLVKSQYTPDMLTKIDKATPLIRGRNLLFTDLQAVLNLNGTGCPGDILQYVCMEFAQGNFPRPHFILSIEGSRAIICKSLTCQETAP